MCMHLGSSKKSNKITLGACEAENQLISFVRFFLGHPLLPVKLLFEHPLLQYFIYISYTKRYTVFVVKLPIFCCILKVTDNMLIC